MKETSPTLDCLRLRFEIQARKPIELPSYKGSTLRGVLGMALKHSCCAARHRPCDSCLLRFSCLYVYFFETPLMGESPQDLRYRNAPHPFVLQILMDGPLRLEAGQLWSFDMTVIGRAIQWTPYLVMAAHRMGDIGIGKGRGTFDLRRVLSLNAHGHTWEELYSDGTLRLPKKKIALLPSSNGEPAWKHGRMRFRFLTPLRLVAQGEPVRRPDFPTLMATLLRRLENLCQFHADSNEPIGLNVPFSELLEKARWVQVVEDNTRWFDWERYSHRQGRKMRLGGLVGEVVYEGDWKTLAPLVSAGRWIHVGKGTSFGLGRYEFQNALKGE
ncbi:MAG: CRISPR system precrRNA processing endoribonuclease RAMP protein Cas6 [Desulfosoma sp.]|uniref:CRISPR system precrRNA processing endoribonuclease RAMP protein Cas6 n=1 Tax=Desulfosoma sp. TaxID=2603217 RepID=UPI004049F9DC